ncbi:CCR4-NOT transcription complex subunit 10 isoform X2 [Eurosta solidaginis]|uniref:CCR4-NOT transcription complex subunit 10 isoform X2 n=1 Tax=Eurosta solidaginis TaxID=178769 RepID=UPI003530F905
MEITGAEQTENKYEHNEDVEQEYKLIEKAYENFSSGNYERCLEVLDELEKCKGINSKLQHNRAVTKFYQSGCKDHGTLLMALSCENADQAGLATSSSSVQKLSVSPIARYNIAVIYYHRHMYQTAVDMLIALVNQLDELEQQIAGLVSTFMLRLLLVTNQLRKATAFLEMLQSPEHKGKLNLSRDVLATEETTSTALSPPYSPNHENVQQAYKFLALQTYVLNRKPIVVTEDGSAEYSALKAHQYYIMKDFQMAAKQLKKVNEIESNNHNNMLNTCIANNMGVIHLRVRHYAIAAKFFQDAITFDKCISGNLRNASLYQKGTVRTSEILYNLGVAMLHLRRPKEAYKCFYVSLKAYHSNPRLWFRISEACIMDHEMKMLEEDQKPIVTSVVNSGGRKMYFLKPTKSITYSLLGHMYAGEALIMLDKLGEARTHFEPTFVSSLNAFDFETKDWGVKSLDAAQNVVRYNLAVVMALQGDFELSRNVLSSCTHSIVAHKVLALKTYLDIKTGKCI